MAGLTVHSTRGDAEFPAAAWRLDFAPDTRYFDGRSSKAAKKRRARRLKDEGGKVVGGH